MHCPRCGHQQNSDELRFCTKCGLEIGDVKDMLAPELRQKKLQSKSERNKAQRQGMMMIFSGFVVILILAILRDFVPVPKSLFAVSVLIFIIGGAIRMSMPSLFGKDDLTDSEGNLPTAELETSKLTGAQFSSNALPEAENRAPLNFGEQNFDTKEFAAPSTVTENTTRKLQREVQHES